MSRRHPADAARRPRRRSPVGAASESLYDYELATYDSGDLFDQSLAKGFVELWGLPSKMAAQRDHRLGTGHAAPRTD